MATIKKWVKSILGGYGKLEYFVLIFLTLLFGALNMIEVFRRAMGMQSFRWIEEFSKYMLIITTMIGTSIAVNSDGHMIMDTLLIYLPKRIGWFLRSLTALFSGAFWLFLGYYSFIWVEKLIKIGLKMATVRLPVYIIWIPFAICCVTAGLRYLVQCVIKFKVFLHPDQAPQEEEIHD